MQSPIRALLYGIAICFVWVSLVVFSAEIPPTGIGGLALFVSMPLVALAALVLGFTILYLRKVREGSFGEGLLVGLGWVVIMIAIDLAHSVVMPEMVPDIGAHFATVVPSYVVVPIITTLTMGYLERRSLKPKS
ncbi:MAG: hypothetical protein M3338_04440 [Actinomycetota bacterium]|nr:hypothetical protein [Actinomycetota bacterium]